MTDTYNDNQSSLAFSLSEVRVIPVKTSNNLVGFASCVVNKCLKLDNIGIVTTPDGLLKLSYPTKKLANGEKYRFFYPIDTRTAEHFEKAILNEYEVLQKQKIEEVFQDE